jgi:hypothetical protein
MMLWKIFWRPYSGSAQVLTKEERVRRTEPAQLEPKSDIQKAKERLVPMLHSEALLNICRRIV